MKARTRNIILIVSAIIFLLIAWYFRSIVTYIIISAILGVIGRPMVRWLIKLKIGRFRLGASVSALITLVAIWIFFFSLFRFTIPLLASEFEELSTIDVNEYLLQLEEPVNKITRLFYGQSVSLTDGSLMNVLGEKITSFFKVSQVTDLFGTIASILGQLLIGAFSVSFITFFFLRDENMFRNGLMILAPIEYEERVSKSIDRMSYLLRRYFVGVILEVIMVMALDTLGLVIIGLDFTDAMVIGMFCGLFNVIPYLGPWIGATIGVLIGLAININSDFMLQTLPLIGYMVIVFASVQLIDNVLFQPLIYSSSVKAHPMEIFLVILAAGSLAGIIGMILAIPVYTIFRVFGAEFLSEFKLIKKLTENMDREVDKKFDNKVQ
jgi:predicted PurR-regulated permease PerM